MDIITSIEECIDNNLPISVEQDGVHINGNVLPGETETVFYSNDRPILLNSLVAAIIYSKKYIDYRTECTRNKIGSLEVMTRNGIIRYFIEKDKNTNLIRLADRGVTTSTEAYPLGLSDMNDNANVRATSTPLLVGPSKRLSEWTIEDVFDDEISCSSKAAAMKSSLPAVHEPLLESLNNVVKHGEKIDLIKVMPKKGLISQTKVLSSSKAAALLPASSIHSSASINAASASSSKTPQDPKKQRLAQPQTPISKEEPRGMPIIIVPAARTAMIGLHNAEQFIFQGKYVPLSECDVSNPPPRASANAPHMIICKRASVLNPKPNATASFMITDAPEKLSQGDWERVIAIFVSGQQWQLKSVRLGKNPTEIFGKVPGFYMHYENDTVHDNAKTWPLSHFELSRTKRHLDSPLTAAFWSRVIEHVSHNPVGKLINY